MNGILEIDPAATTARVQPGVVLDMLRNRAEQHGLTFGPDPSTHSRCSLGGMIGNNSCGTHSLLAGKTVDNVEELRVLLYDGTQLTVGATFGERTGGRDLAGRAARADLFAAARDSRHVRGFDSRALSEHSAARLRIQPRSTAAGKRLSRGARPGGHRRHLRHGAGGEAAADPQPAAAARWSRSVTATRLSRPITCRKFWSSGRSASKVSREQSSTACAGRARPIWSCLPQGRGFLLVEFGSDDAAEAEATARRLMARLSAAADAPDMRLYSKSEARHVWKIRESGARSAAAAPGLSAGMGRLGRFGCGAGKARRIPARSAQAARRIRLQDFVLRAFRARLHSHARHVRSRERRRDSRAMASSSSARRTWW